jgi:tetrathionate reductase subunit B
MLDASLNPAIAVSHDCQSGKDYDVTEDLEKKSTAKRPLSRRDFFAASGAAAAAGAGAVAIGHAANGAAAPGPRKQYAMVIDARRCYGVHACTVACKAEYNVPLGENRSWVEEIEKGVYPSVSRNFLPRLCNHCSTPNCVSVCPTGATWKREEDGIVVVDKDICIGCKYCVQACPYDMRFLNEDTGTADKCDFCIHRVSQGILPACVEACPSRARTFGDLSDPHSEVSKLIAENPVTVLRPEKGTGPNVYYIGADHTDEHSPNPSGMYVDVKTNRRHEDRR